MVKLFQGPGPVVQPTSEATAAQIPPGVQQIMDKVETFMPVIEKITGLTRTQISMQLLKTGLKGGNLDTLLNGFLGKAPAPEAKFVRYVKTLAIWVPVGLGLTMFVFAVLYFFVVMMTHMVGKL